MTVETLSLELETVLADKAVLLARAVAAAARFQAAQEAGVGAASLEELQTVLHEIERLDDRATPLRDEWRRRGCRPGANLAQTLTGLNELLGCLRTSIEEACRTTQRQHAELEPLLDNAIRAATCAVRIKKLPLPANRVDAHDR